MTTLASQQSRRRAATAATSITQPAQTREFDRNRIDSTIHIPRSFVCEFSSGIIDVELSSEEPDWLYRLIGDLRDSSFLEPNWDSYNGRPVTFEAAYAALHFAAALLPAHAHGPTVVPASSGGVQLEWHRLGGDLEVFFSNTGQLSASFDAADSDESWDVDGSTLSHTALRRAVEHVSAMS